MRFENLEGIIGKTFQFGYGKNSFTFTISADGVMTIAYNNEPNGETSETKLPYVFPLRFNLNGGVNVGNARIQSSYNATENDELVNIAVLMTKLNAFLVSAKTYTDEQIKRIDTGGESSGTSSTMMEPMDITIDQIADGYSNIIGRLAAGNFIDHVVFEVNEAFAKADASDYEISIGTITNPTSLVPKFRMSTLSQTKVVDIYRTLSEDQEYCIFVSKYEEPTPPPDPFDQQVINNHPAVVSSLTSDASEKIWTVTLSGSNLESSVIETADFGEITGPYMDFGVNIPVEEDHQYRIVQQNPALAIYDGKDSNISNQSGVWTKDKTYTFDGVTEITYNFLLTASTGGSDYVHIYVYDINGETPETAIRVYHVKNELSFKGNSPALSPLQIDFLSANEGVAGVVQNADDQYTITLTGNVTSKTSELSEKFPGLTKKATSMAIFYPKSISTSGIRTIIYNPGVQGMSDVQTASGVSYTDVTYTPESDQNGAWIEIPITEDQTYPIVIMIIDLDTNESTLIGIDNELTFTDPVTEPTESLPTMETFSRVAAYAAAPLAEGDSGKMTIHVISF